MTNESPAANGAEKDLTLETILNLSADTGKPNAGRVSLQAVVQKLRSCTQFDAGVEAWLTGVIRYASENQPQILNDLLKLKFDLSRRLHYVVHS